MLLERYHPIDIIEYIKEHYKVDLIMSQTDKFINSLLYPENLNPTRYFTYIPTKIYYDISSFICNGTLRVQYDLLYDTDNDISDIKVNNEYFKYLSTIPDIIKQYRVTACGIYIKGRFKYNNMILENKKIIYLPESVSDFNFKYINNNSTNNDISIELIDECEVTIIKHIEFIPFDKNIFNLSSQLEDVNIIENLFKYRNLIITDYGFRKKFLK